MKLDSCNEIISMARDLKLDVRRPVESILAFCKQRISLWVRKACGVSSLSELQDIVCSNLELRLIDVWTEEELEAVAQEYIRRGEYIFASLAHQLSDDKFATVMRREHADGESNEKFVAIIDCRGVRKSSRRFFTRWHEIAHILTLEPQMQLPFHAFRSRAEADPIERLMDLIAGEVGFYDPLFKPVLDAELKKAGRLTFEVVERVQQSIGSDASFHATLIACAKRTSTPVIQIQAEMRLKKAEEAWLNSGQSELFPRPNPESKLRASMSAPNAAAKTAGFLIHPNMQVPQVSLVHKHFDENVDVDSSVGESGTEELSLWKTSDGKVCGAGDIHVDVQKVSGILTALLQPKCIGGVSDDCEVNAGQTEISPMK